MIPPTLIIIKLSLAIFFTSDKRNSDLRRKGEPEIPPGKFLYLLETTWKDVL